MVLFNPPYVPTPSGEVMGLAGGGAGGAAGGTAGGDLIAAAWAGGLDGREVVDRFLPQLADLLSYPRGVCYMVAVEENRPAGIAALLARRPSFNIFACCIRLASASALIARKGDGPRAKRHYCVSICQLNVKDMYTHRGSVD